MIWHNIPMQMRFYRMTFPPKTAQAKETVVLERHEVAYEIV
jgi:hypothetical protein